MPVELDGAGDDRSDEIISVVPAAAQSKVGLRRPDGSDEISIGAHRHICVGRQTQIIEVVCGSVFVDDPVAT